MNKNHLDKQLLDIMEKGGIKHKPEIDTISFIEAMLAKTKTKHTITILEQEVNIVDVCIVYVLAVILEGQDTMTMTNVKDVSKRLFGTKLKITSKQIELGLKTIRLYIKRTTNGLSPITINRTSRYASLEAKNSIDKQLGEPITLEAVSKLIITIEQNKLGHLIEDYFNIFYSITLAYLKGLTHIDLDNKDLNKDKLTIIEELINKLK